MGDTFFWNRNFSQGDFSSASEMNEQYSDIDDTYESCELSGKLYGTVAFMSKNHGFIRPNRSLPSNFKKDLVYFTHSDTEGSKVKPKDRVCFKLNIQSEAAPNVHWVKVCNQGPNDSDDENGSDNYSDYSDNYYSDRASEVSEQHDYSNDVYDSSELHGDLYGKIFILSPKGFGFIRPEKQLPQNFKERRKVHFMQKVVDGEQVQNKARVCFRLNTKRKNKNKNSANWVRLCESRSGDTKQKQSKPTEVRPPEPKGLLNGTVITIFKKGTGGLLSPDNPLPSPYPQNASVYFPQSDVTKGNIKRGQRAVFTLKCNLIEKPAVSEVLFEYLNYDPEYEVPRKHDKCGRIFVQDLNTPKNKSTCTSPCAEILPCGHACTKRCGEICQKACPSCHENKQKRSEPKKQKPMASVNMDLAGILRGHVEMIRMNYGFVKAEQPLPEPYNQRKNIYFSVSDNMAPLVLKGQPVFFTLNVGVFDKPSVADIVFAGVSYDPDLELPYKNKRCGHICTKTKGAKEDNACPKQCMKMLACGHECQRKCSENCLKECKSCYEIRKIEEQGYKLEDLDGVLKGKVVSIRDDFGFVKSNRLLPKSYNREKDIHFMLPPDSKGHVRTGQEVVFLLDKSSQNKPCVRDISFASDLDTPAIPSFCYLVDIHIPIDSTDCDHVRFLNAVKQEIEPCQKKCMKSLTCGHACLRKCNETCHKLCTPCFREAQRKKKEDETYKPADLREFLYGTIVNVSDHFGFVKPERKLPSSFSTKHDIYFCKDDIDLKSVTKGQLAVLKLNLDSKERPAVEEISVIPIGTDRTEVEPYFNSTCGHICLSSGFVDNICHRKCKKSLECGHNCDQLCSSPCLSICYTCLCIKTTAKSIFETKVLIEDIIIGHISFVGDGHGYLLPGDSSKQGKKTGVYFSFEGTDDNLQKGQRAVYVLREPASDKPCATHLAVLVDQDGEVELHKVTLRQRPKGQAGGRQQPAIEPVERLEVEAANGKSDRIQSFTLFPRRQLDVTDPKDLNFRIAESQFLRLAQKSGKRYELESVTYHLNPKLIRKFRTKQDEFKRKYGKNVEQSMHVLAFHGTRHANIDKIVSENFRLELCQRHLYGRGIYLSELPQVSLDFGSSLVLCKVLPGKSRDVSYSMTNEAIQYGYDSNRVNADQDGYGWALVIDNPDQILPCYVINYREIDQRPPSPKVVYRNVYIPQPRPARSYSPQTSRPIPAPQPSQPSPPRLRPTHRDDHYSAPPKKEQKSSCNVM